MQLIEICTYTVYCCRGEIDGLSRVHFICQVHSIGGGRGGEGQVLRPGCRPSSSTMTFFWNPLGSVAAWQAPHAGTLGSDSPNPVWPAPLRAAQKVPLLCCFAGVDWATAGWFSDCVFLPYPDPRRRRRSCSRFPRSSFSLCLCFCFCLDQEPHSCTRTHTHTHPRLLQPSWTFDLLRAWSKQPALFCFCSSPSSSTPPSFEIPTRHSDPSRRVAARDSLETTTPPTDSRF